MTLISNLLGGFGLGVGLGIGLAYALVWAHVRLHAARVAHKIGVSLLRAVVNSKEQEGVIEVHYGPARSGDK
jgi:hypothetical protein